MRNRVLGLLGGWRRRSLLTAVLAIGVAGFFAIAALAVHELKFQLDGNALSNVCGTTPDGGPAATGCQTQIFDWGTTSASNTNNVFNADTTVNTSVVNPDNTSGFTAAAFNRDFGVKVSASDNCSLTNTTSTNFCTADGTTFATGSKDIQNISGGGADQGGNWQCNRDNNVSSKVDVMNAYSAVYIDPVSGDKIIYFAMERNKTEGTNNSAFWFLQGDANCVSTGGAVDFTGNHQNGDVLVTSAATSGGGVSSILVFKWAGGANGCIDSSAAPPACDQQPIASGGDCKDTSGDHSVCATTNSGAKVTNTNITVPWLTADAGLGVGHTVVPPDFFEGGINITKAFEGTVGGAPSCFNTFIADTRSSTSAPATLFDFSRGVLGDCKSTTETTPVDNAGNPIPAAGLDIPKDPADAAILVKDKATITVTGVSSFAGNVKFRLCGPFAASSTTVCDTGGVLVDSQDITTNGTYTSAAATVTQAGRYCWRADFTSTTNGVPPSSDSRATECFKVNPVKPTLTTEAGAGPVDFGQPVTDTATLTGTAHKPGTGGPLGSNGSINPATLGGDATGTITFTLYKDTPGPNNCSVPATGTGTNPQTVPVNGDGTYGPVSFTPDAPGLYHWVATYPGDPPNTLAADPVACLDENEDVVVRTIPTEIKTKQSWIPNDTATVSATVGNLVAGGTVRFTLYDNATCSGTALYSETKTLTGGDPNETVGTTNTGGVTGFEVTTGFADPAPSLAGPYSWKVVYTPAASDTAHTGNQSSCDAEHFSITYTNDPGPGSDLP